MKRWIVALLLIILYALMTAPIATAQNNKECGEVYRTYLPLVGRNMIISRFGSTWASAYQFGTLKGADDYQTQRPASVGQVGGMSGVFDFWGSAANPLTAQVVNKKFEIAKPYIYTAGTGTIFTYQSASPGPELAGIIGDDDTSFLSQVSIGDCIRFTYGGVSYSALVGVVVSDTYITVSAETLAELPVFDRGVGPVSFSIGKRSATYSAIETELTYLQQKTIGMGESKLWAALRDGTTHRWAWAKCNRLRAPEDYTTKMHLPIELEFYCREGIWYGETQGGCSVAQNINDEGYTLVNSGTLPANLVVQVTSATGTLTSMVVTNTTNGDDFTWTGSATVGQLLKVDTGAWSVTKAGVGAYSGLTYGTGQNNWLSLSPGSNVITIAITGSTAWSGSLSFWNTYA
jgi:hypothetical protein